MHDYVRFVATAAVVMGARDGGGGSNRRRKRIYAENGNYSLVFKVGVWLAVVVACDSVLCVRDCALPNFKLNIISAHFRCFRVVTFPLRMFGAPQWKSIFACGECVCVCLHALAYSACDIESMTRLRLD